MRSEPHQACEGYKIQRKDSYSLGTYRLVLEEWTQNRNVLFLAAKPMKDAANTSQHSQTL